jgi:hypothetical protein
VNERTVLVCISKLGTVGFLQKNSSDHPVDLWGHTRGHWCICEEFLNEGAPADCPGVSAGPFVRTQFMCSWDFKNEIHLDV